MPSHQQSLQLMQNEKGSKKFVATLNKMAGARKKERTNAIHTTETDDEQNVFTKQAMKECILRNLLKK